TKCVTKRLPLRGHAAAAAARHLATASGHPDPQTVRDVEERVASKAAADRKKKGDGAPSPLHFSLSGTGPAMFPWMAGFCHGLRSRGLVTADTTLVGLSGGAVCSALLAAGADFSPGGDVMACGQEQSDLCRDGRQGLGRLVGNMAEELIGEDALPRLLHSENVFVAVAEAPGGSLVKALGSEVSLHGRFVDKGDVVGALRASTHLPYVSDGYATTTYRGAEVVDAGIRGQMFIPLEGFVHVNIFPPIGHVPEGEGALGRLLVGAYARLNNRAGAPVHAHPYMAGGFGMGIFGRDDLRMRPLARDEALLRHRLGYEAFLGWHGGQGRERDAQTSE
ncbi:hypothetical protein THAOC_16694, partial [Thalassiosira oceanica]